MLNLSPTLFATIVVALFIIVQLHALLAAQNNLMLADGQCGSELDYLVDFDPKSSTAPDVDQQNTTYLEHALAERDFEDFFSRDVKGATSRSLYSDKPLPKPPLVTVELTRKEHSWLAQIGVGSPPQSVSVEVDPGLSDSWVFTTESKNKEYHIQKHDRSGTAKRFNFEYRGMGVLGNAYRATVTLGTKIKLQPQHFVCVTKPESAQQAPQPWVFEGALGLNYTASSPMLKQPSFMYNAFPGMANSNSKPIFAFYLSEDWGELHLGRINENSYTGDIQYYKTSAPTRAPIFIRGFDRFLYWFELDGQIKYKEKALISNVKAAVDVGTYFITGPPEEVKVVYESMGVKEKINDQYVFPCKSLQELSPVGFQWGDNKEWSISPENFEVELEKTDESAPTLCTGIIQADQRLKWRKWILGSRFMMKNVYTVYDPEKSAIGFGTLKPRDKA